MEEKKGRLDIGSRCHVNTNSDGDKFVGVKADTNDAIVYFPLGYDLPTEDGQLRTDVRNLFDVLSRFMKEEKTFQTDKRENPYTVDFPLHAYFRVIQDYLNRGYYVEKEKVYETNTRGKVDWGRTVRDQRSLVTKSGNLIFPKMTVCSEAQDTKNLITQINRYCVYESFDKLGWLYLPTKPAKYSLPCSAKQAEVVLRNALGNTNEEGKKSLFKAMIDILKYLDDHSDDRRFFFGTDDFASIWEKMVDNAFGINDKDNYLPRAKWHLDFGAEKEKKPLMPDTIMVYQDKCYVLDAKFYRYGSTGIPDHLPNATDINKQITYGEFVHENYGEKFDSKHLFNAFIMPFNKNHNLFGISSNIASIGEAVGDWKPNREYYERIQGIVIDTRHLMFHFQYKDQEEWSSLADCIEKVKDRVKKEEGTD